MTDLLTPAFLATFIVGCLMGAMPLEDVDHVTDAVTSPVVLFV